MRILYKLVLAAAATYSVNATTIQFASNSTAADATQNNSVGNNVVIAKNPAWANPVAGSQWISFSNTGDPSSAGFSAPANGTVVSFFQHFTLTAGDLSTAGTVSLYADDSAAILLNGHILMPEGSFAKNKYSTCSDVKPNCTSLTTLVLLPEDFVLGGNTLEFDVAQRAGSSYGLDYSGSAGSSVSGSVASTVPEPATWALMVTGALLLGVGLLKDDEQI
jgi:hypothetical protein